MALLVHREVVLGVQVAAAELAAERPLRPLSAVHLLLVGLEQQIIKCYAGVIEMVVYT